MAKGTKGRAVKAISRKPRLLWIGDAVSHTGFATVTHNVLENLKKNWEVIVLGVNYYGDPHNYTYPVYPAPLGGDIWGLGRLDSLMEAVNPDIVLAVNDPWIVKDYIPTIKKYNKPFVAYMPVDGKNMRRDIMQQLNSLSGVIGYTQFGIDEMRSGGLTAPATVIPHGVNNMDFSPIEKSAARQLLAIPDDWFIVGCVNRNQPRKRYDLLFQYFAEWVQDKSPLIKLYCHCALKDAGWDLVQMSQYYGIDQRLMVTSEKLSSAVGVSIEKLRTIYNSFDVQVSTTMGEGWGLTTMEGMACRIPQIVPDWSALGEWARGAADLVPCSSTGVHPAGINTVGGVVDRVAFIESLERMYTDQIYRSGVARSGYALSKSDQFMWKNISSKFNSSLINVLSGKKIDGNN